MSIVGIGPLTNIALAAKTYPEIIENVQEIFIMGGNIKGSFFYSFCSIFKLEMNQNFENVIRCWKHNVRGRIQFLLGSRSSIHCTGQIQMQENNYAMGRMY